MWLFLVLFHHFQGQALINNEIIEVAERFPGNIVPVSIFQNGRGSAILTYDTGTRVLKKVFESGERIWSPRVNSKNDIFFLSEQGGNTTIEQISPPTWHRSTIATVNGAAVFSLESTSAQVALLISSGRRPYSLGGSVPTDYSICTMFLNSQKIEPSIAGGMFEASSVSWNYSDRLWFLVRSPGHDGRNTAYVTERKLGKWLAPHESGITTDGHQVVAFKNTAWVVVKMPGAGDGNGYVYALQELKLESSLNMIKIGSPLEIGYIWNFGVSDSGELLAVVRGTSHFALRRIDFMAVSSRRRIASLSRVQLLNIAFDKGVD